ncbi:MAG: hypothetical protein H6686_13015 [Fibrobacteria bacterium]|nr:hypothetical protein [Fibrobacteria bacterium]
MLPFLSGLLFSLVTILVSAWEQRSPVDYAGSRVRQFQGRLLTFTPEDDSFHLDQAWESRDSGRTWFSSALNRSGKFAWDAVKVGGEEIVFEIQRANGIPGATLIRTDAKGRSVVLEGVRYREFQGDPPLVSAFGDILFVRADSGLMRSVDLGKTWQLQERCLAEWPYRPSSCASRDGGSGSWNLWMVSGKLITIHAARVWRSADSGKSWDTLPGILNWYGNQRGAILPNGSSLVLQDRVGAPLELRLGERGWDTVRLANGWPVDSSGLQLGSRDLANFHDTLWALAPRSLQIWDPVRARWLPAPVALPPNSSARRLDTLFSRLWIESGSSLSVIEPSGLLRRSNWPGSVLQGGRISLAWDHDQLWSCSWSECSRSTDSGSTWIDASAGIEGALVSSLVSTSRGLVASTEKDGILIWIGGSWKSIGLEGLPVQSSGRFEWFSGVAHRGDSLLCGSFYDFSGSTTRLQSGSGQHWISVDSGLGGGLAYGDGYWWGRSPDGSLRKSVDGVTWFDAPAPFRGRLNQIGNHVVLTGADTYQDSNFAWLEEGRWVVDSTVGPVGFGSRVSMWGGRYAVLNGRGVVLAGPGGGRQILPIPSQTYDPWLGAILGVGERLFVANSTGLWTRTLSVSEGGVEPRARSGFRLVGRGLRIPPQRSHPIEVEWFRVSGQRIGGTVIGQGEGRDLIPLPIPDEGLWFVRIRCGSEERAFPGVGKLR